MADASDPMTDRRSALALPPPQRSERSAGRSGFERIAGPAPGRQGERLTPQFRALQDAFEAQRARLDTEAWDQDPELIVVFDIVGSASDFTSALAEIDGLEFLAEQSHEVEGDDEFYKLSSGERRAPAVADTLYLVMSNEAAVEELIRCFELWQQDQSVTLPRRLAPLKEAFARLREIRRWEAHDRVHQTGLLEAWREDVEIAGGSPARVEVELWYRTGERARQTAEAEVRAAIGQAGGTVISGAELTGIAYHAILADLPHQEIERVLNEGPEAIALLRTEHVMLVGPSMVSEFPVAEPIDPAPPTPATELPSGAPRIALLDGLPVENHAALAGRLIVDDPDGRAEAYPASRRSHGTAMASIIIHGDLSKPGPPAERPLYVQPILEPHPFVDDREITPRDELLVDLIHRAFRRMFDDGPHQAAAQSVRVVNLSIGDPARQFVRQMSPLGRLIDWVSHKYNVVVVISAGNHDDAGTRLPADILDDAKSLSAETLRALHGGRLLRRLLSPAEAINAITVGALHDDAATGELPDSVLDPLPAGAPATYSPTGFGFGRSVKPEVLLPGGRQVHQRPPPGAAGVVELGRASTAGFGPGIAVAAPDTHGRTDAVTFIHGTSNAAAAATRALDQILGVLETMDVDGAGGAFPDAQYHPVLAKTLLVHAAGWNELQGLAETLELDTRHARRDLTRLLGYGPVRPDRLATAERARVLLIGAASISADERHTFTIPLPPSLAAQREWRRLTVTLSWLTPLDMRTMRYRRARLRAEPAAHRLQVEAQQADHNAIYKGTVQHQIFEGDRAAAFVAGDDLSIDVECRGELPADSSVRYGLAASIEVAPNLFVDLHDEVQSQLRERIRAREQVTVR